MSQAKYFNEATQQWELLAIGGQGPQGEPGQGLATGGTEGQILAKIDGTDFNTEWIDNYAPDTRIIVKNDSGATIAIGTPVMAVGAVGDRIQVAKAVADGSIEPRFMLGLAFEEILNGEEGYLTLTGDIKGVNTNSYTLGDVLYIDPSTPGALTTTAPSSPNLSMAVAIVTKVNQSAGHIFVRMWNQQSGLHELHDVLLDSTIAENELFVKNGAGLWVNKTASEAGVSEVGHTHDDLYYTEIETDNLLNAKASLSGASFTGDISATTIKSNRVAEGNEGGELQLMRASDNNTGWTIDAYGSDSQPDLRIFDNSGNVRLRIDGSGRVTTPATPAFHAYGNTTGSTTYGANATVSFDVTRYNDGNHYNTSTSRFTAPVSGMYLIWFEAFNVSGGERRVSIRINGDTGTQQFGQGQTTVGTSFRQSAAVKLAANDYVSVMVAYADTGIYRAGNHNEFGGCLLG